MRNFPKFIFSLNFLYITLIAAQVAAIIFLCFYIPSFLPMAAAFALIWLLSATSATVLFLKKSASEIKCAWFVLIAAIPVAGSLIYLFASVRKKPCGLLKVNAPKEKGLAGEAQLSCGTCEAGYDSVTYFSNGTEFFKSLISEISRAKKRVYIEFFILSRGHIMNAVLSALEKAAGRGAEIKIITDGIGSAFRINRKDLKRFKTLGAEVKVFHKITPFPRARLNFRDHRKIVAIDGKVAFTGGVNLADEYANITSPYGYWKDNGVAIYGGAAKIFEGMFLSVWNGNYRMDAPEGGKNLCLPYYDSPPHRTFCEDAYINAISRAKTRVHVFTPYLCVSDKTFSAIVTAARRGVDVKIIIPHVPDKKYAFAISKVYARELTECGVEVYEFTPGFMHAKLLIADEYVFLGSYNLDYRSTHFNFECGVMLSGTVAEEAECDFKNSLALSESFKALKVSPAKKLYGTFLKLLAPLI